MKENVQEILQKANNLQYNFHIAIKVSKLLDDDNASINDLSKLIEADQALTVKLLKHCNSAEYGFSKRVTTVKDAIARIGFKILKTMIFTIVSKSSFNQEIKGYGLEKGDLWRNSISCAVYSRYLAKLIDYNDPDQAFTAGLLRDIGKLILHEYVRKEYDEIERLVNKENITFSEAEEKIIGLNHCQLGALVADKWNFPQILIDTIKYHHNPEKAEQDECEDMDLLRIVHFADYLTVMLGYGIGKDSMLQEIDMDCVESLGPPLCNENMESLISDIVNLNPEIEHLISNLE
ncbi:MAG: hypothetical protein A2Y25_11650 [Candidatus Melainabacteria bacterium GWF2_37_15]|nr:MAG: hypothetical protein A2Y25_11650 [Candidatus Melainabacteria bacterium GWF2_37_15]